MFVSDLRQVGGFLQVPPWYNWNIVESGIASLSCSASNHTLVRGSFFFTRCKMVHSEVFSWVNWIHKQHIDFMILLNRIYLELPKICSSCLSRHALLHNFV
jgi:hypothetical protein